MFRVHDVKTITHSRISVASMGLGIMDAMTMNVMKGYEDIVG